MANFLQYAANVQPPYDFVGTWAAIHANTSAGAYQSEYEFGWAVYRAAQLAHDGHFVFYPDSVTGIFSFGRDNLALVSVSSDGMSDPQPYLYSDVIASLNGTTGFTPSPVTQINGQNAVDYLLSWSEYGSLQDPDALWNNLFWEPAQVALGASGTGTGSFNGGGRGRWPYPGADTVLSFANGSTLTRQNYANVLQPFDNITSSADVYTYFLIPPPEAYQNAFEYAASLTSATTQTTESPTSSASSTPTAIPAPAYPTPFVSTADNVNSGYLLEGDGYDDTAVLVMRSFVGDSDDEIPFQAVNTYLIEQAAAMGKTKLIIDVSANGGGTILQGYDVFKQLFPSILPYGASRFRAHEALDLLGEQASYLSGLVPRSLDLNSTYQDIVSSFWNYRTDTDNNYQPFTSWAEKYGPEALGPQPDNFTSLERWNLSDVLTPLNSGGIYVSGYLNRSNITTQPFAAENIILVTDGYCASTCTIFAELMKQQGGVKQIILGGRPGLGSKIPQAIGGVKGTNDLPFDYIFSFIAEVYGASSAALQAAWQKSVLATYSALPLYRSTNVVVNARNGYRRDDPTQTPLQFVYEPADCRILYTPDMLVDETAVWKTVRDSVWGGGLGNKCVAGGFQSGTAGRRSVSSQSHTFRADVDFDEIVGSFELETIDKKFKGDSIMIP